MQNRDIFSIFFSMKIYCVFSQYTIFHFQYEKEKHPKLSQICSYGFFSKGLKNEFETAMVNEPSVFEPLKFYCICIGQNCLVDWLSIFSENTQFG